MWVSKEVRDTCYKNRDTFDEEGNPRTICHHVDLNHDNNDPENLIFLSKHEHDSLHGKLHKGCKRTEETKRKISEAGKGRTPWNKGKTDYTVNRVNGIGWHQSDETKERISKNSKSGTPEVRAKVAKTFAEYKAKRKEFWQKYKLTHPEITWNEFQSLYRTLSKQAIDVALLQNGSNDD